MANMFKPVETNLPIKQSLWSKVKAFCLQDAKDFFKIELTPKQQKIENEINEFLYQEITWQKVHDFLFQEITFRKKEKSDGISVKNIEL